MPFAQLSHTNMFYQTIGHGNESILLLGGIKADHHNWDNILHLLKNDFTIITPDNRGAGQTDYDRSQPFSIADMANDIRELIEYLSLNKPIVVGHSLGGAIVQSLAQGYKNIKRIVLCNTFPYLTETGRETLNNISSLYQAKFTEKQILRHIFPWGLSSHFLENNSLNNLTANLSDSYQHQAATGYLHQLEALLQFDSTAWINDIHVDTLVIGSSEDILTPLHQSIWLAKKIHNAKLKILPGGHASSIEQPEMFVNSILH